MSVSALSRFTNPRGVFHSGQTACSARANSSAVSARSSTVLSCTIITRCGATPVNSSKCAATNSAPNSPERGNGLLRQLEACACNGVLRWHTEETSSTTATCALG